MMLGIPYAPMDQQQLESKLKIMCEGNILLRKWAEYWPKKRRGSRSFRVALFRNYMEVSKKVIPENKRPEFLKDIQSILLVKQIEWDMICGFVNLARKIAARWAMRQHCTYLDRDTFEQEAVMGLIDAIYGYRKPEIKFITYVWVIVNNRIMSAVMAASPLSYFSKDERVLYKQYEDLHKNENLSFEEIIQRLALSENQIKVISEMLVRVIHASEYGTTSENDNYDQNDITSYRVGAEKDLRGQPTDDFEFWDAVKIAGLTNFEMEVLNASIQPYYGWQTDVAAKHINPRTQKAYTRAGTAVALETAYRKIKRIKKLEVA